MNAQGWKCISSIHFNDGKQIMPKCFYPYRDSSLPEEKRILTDKL